MRRILPLLLALCLAFSLPPALLSCGGETGEAEGVAFIDALGREVILPERPRRVACLSPSLAELWLFAGGELVASAEGELALALSPSVISLGSSHAPSMETLLSASPDLVIGSASSSRAHTHEEILSAAGIPVIYLEINTVEGFASAYRLFCRLLGEAASDFSLDSFLSELAAIRAGYAPEAAPRVLFLRAGAGKLSAKGRRGTVLGYLLDSLGCRNIADDDASLLESLSLESILSLSPDLILIVPMGGTVGEAERLAESLFSANPAWRELAAVMAGRVYYLPPELYHFAPNARWVEAYRNLIEVLQDE